MDQIVAACHFEGDTYIFTNTGKVFKMYRNISGTVCFELFHNLFHPGQ